MKVVSSNFPFSPCSPTKKQLDETLAFNDSQDYTDQCQIQEINSKFKKNLKNYRVLEEIYRHAHKKIYLGQHKDTLQRLIVKVSPRFQIGSSTGFHQKSQNQFQQILSQKTQKHLVSIKQIVQFEFQQVVVMEYACRGDLSAYHNQNSKFNTDSQMKQHLLQIKNILWRVVLGLEEIHKLGYVYRDLKPSNILITHQGIPKLSDFEFTIKKGSIDGSLCGTPEYMPPQRLTLKRKNTPIQTSLDMWSFGIIAYQLLMGKTPYSCENDNIEEFVSEIYEGYISFDNRYPDYCRHFVYNLLQLNPKKRLTIEKVKSHPFFNTHFQILETINAFAECTECSTTQQ